VTEEGVEGEVAAAVQVEAANELTAPVESDLLGESAPASKGRTSAVKKPLPGQAPSKGSRRKSSQMALFDTAAETQPKGTRVPARAKPRATRRKT
jgi:hypothetical protein